MKERKQDKQSLSRMLKFYKMESGQFWELQIFKKPRRNTKKTYQLTQQKEILRLIQI